MTKKSDSSAGPTSTSRPDVPRQKSGKFAKGNPGKKRGTLSWEKRKIADAARELFEKAAPKALQEIFNSRNLVMKMRALEFLAERAYGKAPITVRAGIDPDSPEGILLLLANQHIPGSASGSTETT